MAVGRGHQRALGPVRQARGQAAVEAARRPVARGARRRSSTSATSADALTPEEALALLRERAGRPRRARGRRCASAGCPPTRRRRAGSATPTRSCAGCAARRSTTASSSVKLKVGADLDDDVRRCTIAREAMGPAPARRRRQPGSGTSPTAIAHMERAGAVRHHLDRGADEPRRRARPRRDRARGRADRRGHRRARARTGSIFKQLLQADAIDYCQIDACRLGGRQRGGRGAAAGGQVRRAGVPARRRRRPVRARPAPGGVRLRRGRRRAGRTAWSSTSTTCTSTSSIPWWWSARRYVPPERAGLQRRDASASRSGAHLVPGGEAWRHGPRVELARARHRRRLRHRRGDRAAARRARRAGRGARPRRDGVAPPLVGVRADVTDDAAVRAAVDEAVAASSAGSTCSSTTPASARRARSRTTTTTSGAACSTSTSSGWCAWPAPRCRTCASPGRGAIVNTSSIAATGGPAAARALQRDKGAILSLTLAMAADHVREGIRVNCVSPGTADTPWVAEAARARPTTRPPSARRCEARQPIGRMVSADEVAEAIVYLGTLARPRPAPRSPSTAACRLRLRPRWALERRQLGSSGSR